MIEFVDINKTFSWLEGQPYLVGEEASTMLMRILGSYQFKTYRIDGSRITSEGSFFDEVAKKLNFPAYFGRNWNALIDCLGDFQYRPERRVAIIWEHADHSRRQDFRVFLERVYWFRTLATDLETLREDRSPTQVELFLTGNGRDFRVPAVDPVQETGTLHPSALSDEEWARIQSRLRDTREVNRSRLYPMRLIVDGILFKLYTGSPWRKLPEEFPPEHTLYYYYRKWKQDGMLDYLRSVLDKRASSAHGDYQVLRWYS